MSFQPSFTQALSRIDPPRCRLPDSLTDVSDQNRLRGHRVQLGTGRPDDHCRHLNLGNCHFSGLVSCAQPLRSLRIYIVQCWDRAARLPSRGILFRTPLAPISAKAPMGQSIWRGSTQAAASSRSRNTVTAYAQGIARRGLHRCDL